MSTALSCILFTRVNRYFFGKRSVEFVIVNVCLIKSLHFTITLNSEGSFLPRSCLCIYAPSFSYAVDHNGIFGAPLEIKTNRRNEKRCFASGYGRSRDCQSIFAAMLARRRKLDKQISYNAR
jgi:hypothetical protein